MIIGSGQPLTPAQEQNSWPYKAVLALKGNQTIAGCVLLSMLGRQAKNPPAIVTTATVDAEGMVWVGMVRGSAVEPESGLACIGTIADVRDEFRRLADYLKLDDAERIEMFDELRKWVAIDMRADHAELKGAKPN